MSGPATTLGLVFHPKVDGTLGALLLGGVVGTALWGVACVQAYIFYMDSTTRDRKWLKFMVAFIWLIDTLDSALIVHILYYYMVSNFSNAFAVLKPVCFLRRSVMAAIAMAAVTNFVVRGMFLTRVYRMSNKNKWLTGIIGVLSTADLGAQFNLLTMSR
ncbi:hypothetical protein BJ165DRAFT_745920 [Panaeolus papilionaceus]|nr:hypothetical protein BJ165DRAFT_745920 [Panaeolus papilionaceus]